jgi:hypothetical protein
MLAKARIIDKEIIQSGEIKAVCKTAKWFQTWGSTPQPSVQHFNSKFLWVASRGARSLTMCIGSRRECARVTMWLQNIFGRFQKPKHLPVKRELKLSFMCALAVVQAIFPMKRGLNKTSNPLNRPACG